MTAEPRRVIYIGGKRGFKGKLATIIADNVTTMLVRFDHLGELHETRLPARDFRAARGKVE